MSLDYDLVIIGNTNQAFFAASEAIKFHARVALVLGDVNDHDWQEIDSLIFNYLTYIERHWQNLNNWYLNINLDSWLDFNQLQKWKKKLKKISKKLRI